MYKHCKSNSVYFSRFLKKLVSVLWGWCYNTEICRTVNKTIQIRILRVHLFGLIQENTSKSSIEVQYITLIYWRNGHKCYGLWRWRRSRLPLFACCIFCKPPFWFMSTSTKRLSLHNIITQSSLINICVNRKARELQGSEKVLLEGKVRQPE